MGGDDERGHGVVIGVVAARPAEPQPLDRRRVGKQEQGVLGRRGPGVSSDTGAGTPVQAGNGLV
jgi:hypothetical protein